MSEVLGDKLLQSILLLVDYWPEDNSLRRRCKKQLNAAGFPRNFRVFLKMDMHPQALVLRSVLTSRAKKL
jgi:hypothetical protein